MYPKVSVIIPVYNVEPYIERCIHSLFNQTLKEIEYIFIDDCCGDHSIDKIKLILNDYPNRKSQVKILTNSINKGLAYSRGLGLKNCSGEYIIHCDSDDYIEKEMYETMYNHAIKYNFDLVSCDILMESGVKKELISFYPERCARNYLKKGIKNGLGYASGVNKLIKSTIIKKNNILPYENCNYGEDLGFILRILYYANSIGHINYPFYHYCRRNDSITGKPLTLEDFKSLIQLSNKISNFFQGKGYDDVCNCFKFQLKLKGRHLFAGKEKEWIMLFKECRKDIFKFSDNSLKSRIIWWLAMQNVYLYKFISRNIKV